MDILHSGSSEEHKLHWIFPWDFYSRKGMAHHWKIGRAFYREDTSNTELLIVGSHAYWPGEMQEKTRAKVEPSGLGSTI